MLKTDTGLKAQCFFYARDVGNAVADVALAIGSRDVGQEVFSAQDIGQGQGDVFDGCADSAADVEGLVIPFGFFHGEDVGLDDVVDGDEVPRLFAVFVDDGSFVVFEAAHEDGSYTRIGVGERLPGSKDVEVAQGY